MMTTRAIRRLALEVASGVGWFTALNSLPAVVRWDVLQIIEGMIPSSPFGSCLGLWCDAPGRTKADILALIRKGAARAEAMSRDANALEPDDEAPAGCSFDLDHALEDIGVQTRKLYGPKV